MKKNSYLLLFTALLSFITGTIIAQENIISENGNIGLGTGTTAPTSRLTVAGSARIDSALVVNDSVSIAASARVGEDLKVEGNLYLPNIPVLSIYKDEAILFTNAEGMTSKGDINLLKSLIYAEPVSAQPLDFCEMVGYMDHPTWANGPNKLYSACPQVFIGVGTASPAFPLDVNGSAKVSNHLWANGSLSVGADVNPFSKLNVVNTNRPAAIQVSTVGNPKPYQRLMFFEYDNPDTKILEVQNPTSGYTAFSLKANGEMDIHNGTAPIFHLGTDGMLSIRNNSTETFRIESSGITRARKVIVDTQAWADYVFDENYSLMPLSEVENFLKEHKHLPAIPSEKAMKDEGIDLAEMNVKMMEKIEELTLYLIRQNKELEQVKAELETLKQQKP